MNLRLHPLMKGYKYYFSTLPPDQQFVYIDLYDAICKRENATTVKMDHKKIGQVVEVLSADNPLLFYFRSYRCECHFNKTVVKFDYLFSEAETEKLVGSMFEKVKSITEPAKNASDYEKELIFHNFLSKNVRYDKTESPRCFLPTGALLHGSAVCAGVSSAFKLLCDYCRLPCLIVQGEEKGSLHSWNKVRINNFFYNIDVTYDLSLSKGRNLRYDYFNLPDCWISKDGRKELRTTPVCNATAYNYHVVNGLYFDNMSRLENYINSSFPNTMNMRISDSLLEGEEDRELFDMITNANIKACRFSPYTRTLTFAVNKAQGVYVYEGTRG